MEVMRGIIGADISFTGALVIQKVLPEASPLSKRQDVLFLRRFAMKDSSSSRKKISPPPAVPLFSLTKQIKTSMKYMLTWTERSQGSPIEYENAQKRILEVFTQWKAPANFKIELFVIRVGDWGGYMMVDCDDPTAVHKFCSMLPAFVFEARPVIPIADAVRVELEAIAFRDGLPSK